MSESQNPIQSFWVAAIEQSQLHALPTKHSVCVVCVGGDVSRSDRLADCLGRNRNFLEPIVGRLTLRCTCALRGWVLTLRLARLER